ncbi:hypothetical protein [Vibrio sp. THAF190c]|jgi:hypothetical protein|uniref:hypothetical protein n=1 Tax=Vibrio sp. THAF190c TaxID=2587865 RepID=UPI001269813D|nr:hypothetical protein [Vibrio sp. THAF190c]QFT13300.1 hypothetical protein FIV04_25455 [Vibrio sp. THAF190c]
MTPLKTTHVELKSKDRLILFPWLHESNWSNEDKISCCLLHYMKFAQMYPEADLEKISLKVFKLVEALFRAYQTTGNQLDPKKKLEILNIANTENEIVLTMLGLAVVITGKTGFQKDKVFLSLDILEKNTPSHFDYVELR